MLKTVGRYELVELIGQGGMGAVYKAFDPALRRTVAVKLISAVLDDKPDTRERFFREARAAGQLSHRHIIVIYDLGEDGGQPFLAMEYLTGASLDARMSGGRRVSLERAVDLMIDVLGALEYAHERGVVHRDIKPANLFVTDADEVKILDFGLAHLVSSELTRSEAIIGTANYMAPEQVRGERVDRRADLFAAGAVFYELVTGRKAFEGDSFANTLYQVLETVPQPVHAYDPTIPLPLAAVIERALAKRREDRHQTAAEMAREILIGRESLKPMHRYPAAIGSAPTTLAPAMPDSGGWTPAPATGTPPPGRRGIDMPVGPPEPARSVAWSPRRVRTTAVVGIVLAVAGSALLLGPRDEESRPQPAQATATPSATSAPPPEPSETRRAEPEPAPPPPAAADVSVPEPPAPKPEREPPARPVRRSDPPPATPAPPRVDPRATAAAAARADAAIARIGEARTLAETADAATLAAAPYRAALGIEGEVRGLYAAGDFARAAARAGDAESLYRNAETQAKAEAAAQARASARVAEAAPPAVVAPEPPPRREPPQPAPAERPAEKPPSIDHREVIRGVVAQYAAALEGRSIAALKIVWPSLGGAQERAIRSEFENARSVQVQLADVTVAVDGDAATVGALRLYELMTVDGHRLASKARMTMRLRRAGATWAIESVTYQQ